MFKFQWLLAVFFGSFILSVISLAAPKKDLKGKDVSAQATSESTTPSTGEDAKRKQEILDVLNQSLSSGNISPENQTSASNSGSNANATVADTAPSLETSALPSEAQAEQKVVGAIELRPSLRPMDADNYNTENQLSLGYQLNRQTTLSYVQEFNTNLYDPKPLTDQGKEGLSLKSGSGYVKAHFSNLLGDESGVGFSYQARLYLPTDSTKASSGMVGALRNYFLFAHQFSNLYTFTFAEIPIFHFYNKDVANNSANPAFENRVYLISSFSLTDKLAFDFPLMLNSTRSRTVEGLPNSGSWSHYVWVYPELYYALTPNFTVGLAFYNDLGLMSSDLSTFTLGDGLSNGVYQLILKASL